MEKILINNFDLLKFRKLLEQSLIVDNQLILEFSPEFIRACSTSATKTFLKLWTIPLKKLIVVSEKEEIKKIDEDEIDFDDLDAIQSLNDPIQDLDEASKKIINFPNFDFYVLRGEMFKKFLSVHTSDEVELEFTIVSKNDSDKYQAAEITIKSFLEASNSTITTTYILSTEELITNKIGDYSEIIKEMTPAKTMFEFTLFDIQIQEIRRLIKNLHKSAANNVAFLNFEINVETKKIIIKDKVFTISFDITENLKNLPEKTFDFSILKSDFIMVGNKSFTIYSENDNQKILFGGNYGGALIWCLSTKVSENNIVSGMDNIVDDGIDTINIDEYLEL
jgi:hypothetical protein